MIKKCKLNIFFSLIFSCVFVFNCNSFRKDIYANPASVVATVEVSGEIIQFTADVVAMFTAQMHASGIDIDLQDAADALVDYFYYSMKDYEYSEDGMWQWCIDRGYHYNKDNNSVVLDDGYEYYLHYDVFTGTYTYYPCVDDVNDGSSLKDEVLADGTRVKTCVKTTYDTLTKFGASVYDYLHNSSTVEYVPPSPVAQVGNVEQLNSNLQDLIKSYAYFSDIRTISSFDTLLFDNNSYNSVKNIGVVSYDIYVSDCVYPFADDIDFSKDSTAQFYYFSCIGKLADGRYYLPFSVVTLIDNTSPTVQFTEIRCNSAWGIYDDYNALIDYINRQNWSVRAAFYGNTNGSTVADKFGDGYLTHFAVSADGAVDVPAVPTDKPYIKSGDREYAIDPDKANAWDQPDAATSNVSVAGAWDGNDTILNLPGEKDNAWDWDDAVPDVLNPGDVNVSTDIPSDVATSDNVLTWIKDFFTHFFDRLGATIMNALYACFVPSDGYFEYKINELREKHCSSVGTIHFDELTIPDIIWNSYDSRWGSQIGAIVVVDNSFLRNNISRIRPLIAGFIYFVWILHEIFRLVKILNVVSTSKE